MHDEYWEPLERRLRPGGVVLVNDSTFAAPVAADVTVHRVRATELAAEEGSALGASMAMVGAYVALTGLVTLDGAVEAMRRSIPSYRRQHVETNERTIRAGHAAVPLLLHPAWTSVEVDA
jgi:2-oxoglutarate ferredoxin oxidoreductase subunit gamma